MGDRIQNTKHGNFRVLWGVPESTILVGTNYKIQNQNLKFPVLSSDKIFFFSFFILVLLSSGRTTRSEERRVGKEC